MVFLLLCPYAPVCKHRRGEMPQPCRAPANPPRLTLRRAPRWRAHPPGQQPGLTPSPRISPTFFGNYFENLFCPLSQPVAGSSVLFSSAWKKCFSCRTRDLVLLSRTGSVPQRAQCGPLPTCLWEPNSSSGQGSSRLSSSYSHRPYVAPPRLCPRCRV